MAGAEAREAALGWLDRFGLADRRDAELQALSLGNQQRAQLAAALVFVCSLLPPFTPILMAVRMAASDVPFWQVSLAAALTVASIVGLTWLAGRMYSNAALHLGTRVRFMDAFRG